MYQMLLPKTCAQKTSGLSLRFIMRLLSALVFLVLASCGIKNSVFDTDYTGPTNFNSKFSVPSYNMSGGDVARFAILADSHQNYAALRGAIRNINNSGAQFAIHLGDFTDIGTRDEYELFMEYVKDLKIPLYVIPGNHDLTSTGRSLYRQAFGAENRTIDTDFGTLVFWNNNALEVSEGVDNEFLKTSVNNARAGRPVFIFQHQDPYNKLPFSDEQSLFYSSVLQSRSNVIVFNGHLHRFFTQRVEGVPFFQVNRTEEQKWALVEVDNSSVKINYCIEKRCALEEQL